MLDLKTTKASQLSNCCACQVFVRLAHQMSTPYSSQSLVSMAALVVNVALIFWSTFLPVNILPWWTFLCCSTWGAAHPNFSNVTFTNWYNFHVQQKQSKSNIIWWAQRRRLKSHSFQVFPLALIFYQLMVLCWFGWAMPPTSKLAKCRFP